MILPLLSFSPVAGFLVLGATLPLYYTAFHFHVRADYGILAKVVVWFIWAPALALLAWDASRQGYSLRSIWNRTGRSRIT